MEIEIKTSNRVHINSLSKGAVFRTTPHGFTWMIVENIDEVRYVVNLGSGSLYKWKHNDRQDVLPVKNVKVTGNI